MSEITFPITVTGLEAEEMKAIKPPLFTSKPAGSWVSVRLAGEKETRLGILIGDVALGIGATYDEENGKLRLGFILHNPAIWVPALRRIVYGVESWWGVILSPEELREITDFDIENVWYVKALKELAGEDSAKEDS